MQKKVVDPSNPVVPGSSGGFVKIIGEHASAGHLVHY